MTPTRGTAPLQASALSRFEYRIDHPDGTPCARLRMPTWPAMPRGSALRFGGRDAVEIDVGPATYRLEYETFNPRTLRAPDYRYFLMEAAQTRATATFEADRGKAWILAVGDDRWRWEACGGPFSMRYRLSGPHGPAGGIRETTRLLRLRRSFALELPQALAIPEQAFLLFLAVNATYR